MKKNKEVKYELVAIFKRENEEETKLIWEYKTLKEATEQYESVKKYNYLKDLKCNEIVVTKVNLF